MVKMAVDGLEVQRPHSRSLMGASVPSESPHHSGNPHTALPPTAALSPQGILVYSGYQCSTEYTCNMKDGIKENNTRRCVKLFISFMKK